MDRRTFIQISTGLLAQASMPAIVQAKPGEFHLASKLPVTENSTEHDITPAPLIRAGVVAIGGAGTAVLNALAGKLQYLDVSVMLDTNETSLRQKTAGQKLLLDPTYPYQDALLASTIGLDLVFVIAGMGGKTGTDYAPVIAQLLRAKGILTIGAAIMPFSFEDNSRQKRAQRGLRQFAHACDSLFPLPNEQLTQIAGNADPSLQTVLAQAPLVFSQLYHAMVSPIADVGLIGIDYMDVHHAFAKGGQGSMGTGRGTGTHRVRQALDTAMHYPLFDRNSLNTAVSIMVNVAWNPQRTESVSIMKTIHHIHTEIRKHLSDDATLIMAALPDDALDAEISIALLTSGGGLRPVNQWPRLNGE